MNYDDTVFFHFDHKHRMDISGDILHYTRFMHALAGKHILITRTLRQAGRTRRLVEQRGGIPLLFPCLEVHCLPGNIRRGLALLEGQLPRVLFTSPNGVRCVGEVLGTKFDRTFKTVPVAAVGRKTAAALRKRGISNVTLPEAVSQKGLISAYLKMGVPESLVFFRAEEGSNLLAEALCEQGCSVHTIHAYRTICPEGDASEIRQALAGGHIDAVLLGSAKTARYYVQRIGDTGLAGRAVLAVISRQAADSAQAMGLNVQVIAKKASFSSMLEGLAHYFQQHPNRP